MEKNEFFVSSTWPKQRNKGKDDYIICINGEKKKSWV